MALFNVPFMPQDGSLTIEDATGTPISMTLSYTDGDFSIDGFQQDHKTVQEFKSRGVTFAVRKVEDEMLSISWSAIATDLADGTEKTLLDCVMGTGAFSAAVSTLGANADVDTRKVTWTGERTDFGGGADCSITLDYCHLKVAFAEGVPGKFTVSGTAYLINGAGVTIA